MSRKLLVGGECFTRSNSEERICAGVYFKVTPKSHYDFILAYQFQDATYTSQLVDKVVKNVTNAYHDSLDNYMYILFTENTSA